MKAKGLNKRLAGLVMLSILSVPWAAAAAGNSVVSNSTIPQGYHVVAGEFDNLSIPGSNQLVYDISQTSQNSIVKWDEFSIGANATVNIYGPTNFNMLNYVTGGNASQIYGKLNSYDKSGNVSGNIFLVNPSGVQIGNSAQINVGSLYVSNKKLDGIDNWTATDNVLEKIKSVSEVNNTELMSLGYINATKLTFEGQRVVIDMDRLSGFDKTSSSSVNIVSDKTPSGFLSSLHLYDVVLGTSDAKGADSFAAYVNFSNVDTTKTDEQNIAGTTSIDQSGKTLAQAFGYKWLKTAAELQSLAKGEDGYSLDGNYALRYAIDFIGSDQQSIGSSAENAFTGKFDGLGNSIFGLSMDNSNTNKATGLFGYTNGAKIGNVSLIAGTYGVSIKGGTTDTGALIGHATNTVVRNVASTLQVEGVKNVGGLIGTMESDGGYSLLNNALNTGNVSGTSSVGGLIGYMNGGALGVDANESASSGSSRNLGRITGTGESVGGLVGKAENGAVIGGLAASAIGQDDPDKDPIVEYEYTSVGNALTNYASVVGNYNVGGIVGSAGNNVRVQNVQNEAQVLATGYTTEKYTFHTDYTGYSKDVYGTYGIDVRMANVGGIVGIAADSQIIDATNKGDVQSVEVAATDALIAHYGAGNVGGIVGRAQNTNIANVTNKESNIRGAMNVGGIAGYFGSRDATEINDYVSGTSYSITNAQNEGGDILATGGVGANDGNLVQEATRKDADKEKNNEFYNIGNIGGIVGYLDGNMSRVRTVNNNGTVHTEYDTSKVTAQAANIGGIVGKMDTNGVGDAAERLAKIKGDETVAIISGAVNSGAVQGFANIGGVAGFAYNGSIARSFNTGNITTSRMNASEQTPTNMGGILGDSTEQASGRVVLYDVGNKGQIGSSEATSADNASYKYKGRHVGGIVGRLSGIVEQASNDGAIYNGSNVVGGIAGYWYAGNIKNVYNTGNITVDNQNTADSQVGGIVGTAAVAHGDDTAAGYTKAMSITNAYNLGTLRAFKNNTATDTGNSLGGIVGQVVKWDSQGSFKELNITNVYTGGNIWADSGKVGAIVGWAANKIEKGWEYTVNLQNGYFIAPAAASGFPSRLDNSGSYNGSDSGHLGSGFKYITNDKRYNKDSYNFSFSTQTDGSVSAGEGTDINDTWRIYEGSSLPMLNAFLPWAQGYFANSNNWQAFKENNADGSVQYGTGANPLLTIVNTAKDVSFDWGELNLGYSGSLAVKGISADGIANTPYLTLTNVDINNATSSFGGTIYSDGQLILLGKDYSDAGAGSTDLHFSNESRLYGSSVTIKTGGKLELSGSIVATGNQDAEGLSDEEKAKLGVNLEAGELDVYGSIATAQKVQMLKPIIGLGVTVDAAKQDAADDINNKQKDMYSVGEKYAQSMQHAAKYDGVLNIVTKKNTLGNSLEGSTSGQVNILYGNLGRGQVNTYGDLNITSEGDILIDTDLYVGGKIQLLAAKDADPIEIQLDLSNIGGAAGGNAKAQAVQDFLAAHSREDKAIIAANNKQDTPDKAVKVLFDMWDDAAGAFDESKYNVTDDEGNVTSSFISKLLKLKVYSNGSEVEKTDVSKLAYIWVEDAQQLNGIQTYAESEDTDAHKAILQHNFLLKNDIDASVLGDAYNSIGRGDTAFTGTLDGNGKNILGLKAQNGLITDLGDEGRVVNFNIYSSVFTGNEGAGVGAVAGTTHYYSVIDNVTGFGNTVTSGANSTIGGIVGKNGGDIKNVSDQSTVIAGAGTTAGGIAGSNEYSDDMDMVGRIENAQSNSAVTTLITAAGQYAGNLGGIVGINKANAGNFGDADIDNVSSHGVTGKVGSTKNSGGIVGTNNGKITNAYNESIIHGSENIGGIAGINITDGVTQDLFGDGYIRADLEDVANGLDILGDPDSTNVGGLVGMQTFNSTTDNADADLHPTLEHGRNTGTITGGTNVGGMVGYNDKDSYLNELENAPQATISGDKNVGGIAGYNAGRISSTENGLLNKGLIYGRENVGGIAGYNIGTVENVSTDITLYVKAAADGAEIKNFGGIVGFNDVITKDGEVIAAGKVINATNNGHVVADGASYVGGIIGYNTNRDAFVKLEDDGTTVVETNYVNTNEVSGKNFVGGIVGGNTPTSLDKIHAVNSGKVTATEGGAGGVFGLYTGTITDSTLINEGDVVSTQTTDSEANIGTGGITGIINGAIKGSTLINKGSVSNRNYSNNIGGLFGISTQNIAGSTLQNEGSVSGSENVGGLIGVNSGNITDSSLINTVDGTVSGSTNVGGLIGSNTGSVVGGRNAGDTYYKYMVYNNGQVTGTSQNIGGLIGSNAGHLTAAYNTGVVTGNANVGGIAGSNTGSVDQVFNSVVAVTKTQNDDGTTSYSYSAGSVSGDSNIGGIVGYNAAVKDAGIDVPNTGVISNAYNTTKVSYDSAGGNIVGDSVGGRVQNVYGYSDKAAANIGANSAGTVVYNSYVIGADGKIDGKDAKDQNSYEGFDFAGDGNNDAVWKLYATNTNPLLKVFLTKVTVADDIAQNLVYNAHDQLNVAQWIADGKLLTHAAPGFNAYKNNNVLISGKELKNAGTYSNWLWSGQIAVDAQGGGDKLLGPNNLGYDFDVKNITINKKQLTNLNVSAVDVQRTYGTVDGVTYKLNINYGDDFNDDMKAELKDKVTLVDLQSTIQNSQDGAVIGGGSRTNNVGSYSWSSTAKIDDSLAGNYEFADTNAATSGVQAKSDVVRAQLSFDVDDKYITRGEKVTYTGSYSGLVNGDTLASIGFGGYALDGRYDPPVMSYEDVIGVLLNGTLHLGNTVLTNYNVTINPGSIVVAGHDRHDDYWFNTAPWDKERNLRERKAELNYVDGGVSL